MKTIRVALVQFDAKPEAVEEDLHRMASLARQAVQERTRWIVFHEGTVCDYTPRLADLAEKIPSGPSTQSMTELAQEHNCIISFGLSEIEDERYFISQVFVGPAGSVYRYRKTWLWRDPQDEGFRSEWVRYDPGSGPELFELDGVRATCFLCADGEAPRCIERARVLNPQVVFYPNNRGALPALEVFGERASASGSLVLACIYGTLHVLATESVKYPG